MIPSTPPMTNTFRPMPYGTGGSRFVGTSAYSVRSYPQDDVRFGFKNPFSASTGNKIGQFATNLVWDAAWVALANFFLPVALPVIVGLTICGMIVSRRLGLKYDSSKKKFVNTPSEKIVINRKINQIEGRVQKVLHLPTKILPNGTQKETQGLINKGLKELRHYAKTNESFQAFFKVPRGFWGKSWHIFKSTIAIFALLVKSRLSHGIIGKGITLVLGLTMFKEFAGLFRHKPQALGGGKAHSSNEAGSKGVLGILKHLFDRFRGKK